MNIKELIKSKLDKKFFRVASLTVMCAIFTSSVFTVSAFSRDFEIIDGDNISTVKMMSVDTDKILNKAGIKLGVNDKVIRNDQQGIISIKRAFSVAIKADGFTSILLFNDGTVGYALKEANVSLNEYDVVSPGITDPLTPGMEINVTRMYQITIKADGKEEKTAVPKGTVKEALDFAHISLGQDDVISVDQNQNIEENMVIEINRVGYHEDVSVETIPYETIRVDTNELALGKTEVQTSGVNGERVVVRREKIVDGVSVENVVVSDQVTKQPVKEVVLVGTKYTGAAQSVSRTVSGSATVRGNTLVDQYGNVVHYRSVITGTGTAYTAGPGAKTSTGRTPQYGYVAVDPKIIPYGTKMYICSPDGSFVYGYAIAADTGGAMLSGKRIVDLYYDTEDECWQVGVKNLCLYII